ncbi:MAG: hypothetical protein J6S85_07955 [Methanobrevibacter sp.]|nr:hypothetical protein [Methanobrevibacter sp.]
MTKIQTTCTASITASALTTAVWLQDLTTILGLIGTIISAVFGLISIGLLIYNKVKGKVQDNDLSIEDIVDLIKEGKEGAEPYIEQLEEAIEKIKESSKK